MSDNSSIDVKHCLFCTEKLSIIERNIEKKWLIYNNKNIVAYAAGGFSLYVFTQNHETDACKFINSLLETCQDLYKRFNLTKFNILINSTSLYNKHTKQYEKKHNHGFITVIGKENQQIYNCMFNCNNGTPNEILEIKKKNGKSTMVVNTPYPSDDTYVFTDDQLLNFLHSECIDDIFELINWNYKISDDVSIFINDIHIDKEIIQANPSKLTMAFSTLTKKSQSHTTLLKNTLPRRKHSGSQRKNSGSSDMTSKSWRKHSGSQRKNSGSSDMTYKSWRKHSYEDITSE
jgi:hypothetical protein